MALEAAEADRIAAIMGGLATPARVQILARLLDGPATVSELTRDLAMGQATASNHLRILRHLGLASGERHGRFVVYRLQDEHVTAMIEQILSHARH